MRKLTTVAAATVALLAATATPAAGDNTGGAFDNPSAGTITATASTSNAALVSATAAAAGGAVNPCQYGVIPGADLPTSAGTTNGYWVYLISGPASCPGRVGLGAGLASLPLWVATASAGAPSPQALAMQALSNAQTPDPNVATWPPAGHGEVNFPTWVHVRSWAPVSATASAGGVTVTVTATPTQTLISSVDSSDGGASYQPAQTTCPGPGATYDPNRSYSEQHTDCSMTWAWPSAHYRSSSTPGTYPLTVTVVYQVSWAGAGTGGTLPAITRSSTVAYAVGEIEAIGS